MLFKKLNYLFFLKFDIFLRWSIFITCNFFIFSLNVSSLPQTKWHAINKNAQRVAGNIGKIEENKKDINKLKIDVNQIKYKQGDLISSFDASDNKKKFDVLEEKIDYVESELKSIGTNFSSIEKGIYEKLNFNKNKIEEIKNNNQISYIALIKVIEDIKSQLNQMQKDFYLYKEKL